MLDELLLIGNIILSVGTTYLIYAVMKNRKILCGYSLSGSFLTFISLLLFGGWYLFNAQYATFGFATITLIYWAFVCLFKLKYRGK